LRIPADKLREAMRQSRSLEKAFLKFAHSFMNQTANTDQTARPPAKSVWHVGCSWPMTVGTGTRYRSPMSFSSLMLGVRRAGVTVALNYLEHRGVIRLSRKQIVITDRKGLKASANGTYHEPEAPG
jgi:CRP-like cAMP-binding protein